MPIQVSSSYKIRYSTPNCWTLFPKHEPTTHVGFATAEIVSSLGCLILSKCMDAVTKQGISASALDIFKAIEREQQMLSHKVG